MTPRITLTCHLPCELSRRGELMNRKSKHSIKTGSRRSFHWGVFNYSHWQLKRTFKKKACPERQTLNTADEMGDWQALSLTVVIDVMSRNIWGLQRKEQYNFYRAWFCWYDLSMIWEVWEKRTWAPGQRNWCATNIAVNKGFILPQSLFAAKCLSQSCVNNKSAVKKCRQLNKS